eukprot:GHUV01028102.1.p4 GENE.GHUV01028102.1~~GHUV01028102.1.p4  ORF type:complete len:106 (-),score=28.99 GHUV01028102.1:832-1149(-)
MYMQAWYSAAWSHNTLRVFRAALTSIFKQQQAGCKEHLPASVLNLLRHWQLSDVTLAAARSAWLADRNHSCSNIANFKRKCDRMALAEYQVRTNTSGWFDTMCAH